jgi:hypothetical protein
MISSSCIKANLGSNYVLVAYKLGQKGFGELPGRLIAINYSSRVFRLARSALRIFPLRSLPVFPMNLANDVRNETVSVSF